MRQDLFVNAVFAEKDGSSTVTARLRNTPNAKSFRLPNAPEGLAKNDGIQVELIGKLNVGDKYVTPEDFKVLDIAKGAYVPKGESMDAADYFASLAATAPAEEVPFV